MLLRQQVAERVFQAKLAMKELENAENIAPKLPDGKMPFKASPYTKAPQAPKVKVKNEVNTDPMKSPAAQFAADIPVPTVAYNPTMTQAATTPGSMLPPMAPLLPTPGGS